MGFLWCVVFGLTVCYNTMHVEHGDCEHNVNDKRRAATLLSFVLIFLDVSVSMRCNWSFRIQCLVIISFDFIDNITSYHVCTDRNVDNGDTLNPFQS